jgi:hypothetical protein
MKIPILLFSIIVSTLALLLSGGTAAPHRFRTISSANATHRDIIIRERHGNQVTSSNWSGYAVNGAKGSVSDVTGSWIVPTMDCSTTPTGYSAMWVGIDGYSSNTVEQIGTESDCVNGTANHYAWFEFYPHNSITIDSFPIKSNDVLSAEVKYSGSTFTVSLSDNNVNNGKPYVTSTKLNQADRSSAEWIVEAPYSGGVLRLADFNITKFGFNNTSVSGTNSALISGGPFNPANLISIIMTADNGAIKAQPLYLSTDGTSFTDYWYNPGP